MEIKKHDPFRNEYPDHFVHGGNAYGLLALSSTEEYAFSHEMLMGIDKIKLRGAQKRMFSKWSEKFIDKSLLKYKLPYFLKIGTLPSALVSGVFLVYYYFVADKNNASTANFVAFTMLYSILALLLTSLPKAARDISMADAAVKLIKPVMDAVPESENAEQILKNISGKVSFKRVSFRYDEKEPIVVNEVSFDILPGEYVAITGRSGCGKSTLIRLLLGYEQPDSGGVFFDGTDTRSLDMQYVRRQLGCVLQKGALFDGDIFSNLSVCNPDLTIEEAWKITEIAGIADDIRKLPMGMHTAISGGGDSLSGGQKQRLMIARAIASKPKILIFDEATSALDNITQQKVSKALDELGCTRIVIAHRLSTVKNCDRILVMDQGKIVEQGKYEELMKKNGVFKELVELQRF